MRLPRLFRVQGGDSHRRRVLTNVIVAKGGIVREGDRGRDVVGLHAEESIDELEPNKPSTHPRLSHIKYPCSKHVGCADLVNHGSVLHIYYLCFEELLKATSEFFNRRWPFHVLV